MPAQNRLLKLSLFILTEFLLFVAVAYAGYWYGRQQVTPPKKPSLSPLLTPALVPPTPISTQGKIAFVKDGSQAWVLDVESKTEKSLLKEGTANVSGDFVWSPNGQYLTWQPIAHGPPALFLYTWDSQNDKIIESNLYSLAIGYRQAEIATYKWSPDSKFLSWVFKGESSAFHSVYVLQIKTGEINQIMATGACCSIVDYAWSPDGNNVAVLHLDKTGGGPPGYFISIFDTSETLRQTNYLELTGLVPRKISWKSKDKIYILSGEVGKLGEEVNLVEHNVISGNKKSYFLGFVVKGFDPSPDGTKAAYITTADDGVYDNLYLMDLKTGESKSLANNLESGGLKGFQKVKWSPDGRYLALESALIDTSGVEVLDLSGNVLRKAEADPRPLFDEVYKNEKPVQWSWTNFDWSPDSKSLLRVIHPVYPRGLPGLMVKYNLETGVLTKLATTGEGFDQSVWSSR